MERVAILPVYRRFAAMWALRGDVVSILKDNNHQYDRVMFDGTLEVIAKFVSAGQIDMDQYIDRNTKSVKGDRVRGKRLFQRSCARCDGTDGRDMNFSDDPSNYCFLLKSTCGRITCLQAPKLWFSGVVRGTASGISRLR